MQIISAADFPLFCSNSARKSSILCGIRTPLKTPLPKSCQTLVLYYLCKLAGCTLNVQPVNWHKMFSRFKARHGGSVERNYDGKITANLFPRRQYD